MTEARKDVVARILLGGAAMATVAAIALAIFWHDLPRRAPVGIAAIAERASPADEAFPARLYFALLEKPRPLPEVRFTDGKNRVMTLARGRVVLLNLWATWCVPCRKEMPALDRLQATLGGANFQVVPLSIDRQGLSVVKPFYQQLGLKSLGIYVDSTGAAASDLGAAGIPTTLLIDRDGREIGRKMGPAKWDSPEAIKLVRRYLEPPTRTGEHAEKGVSGR